MSCMNRPKPLRIMTRAEALATQLEPGEIVFVTEKELEEREQKLARFSPAFWYWLRWWAVTLLAIAFLIHYQLTHQGHPMSNPSKPDTEQPAQPATPTKGEKSGTVRVASTTQEALNAYGLQLLRSCEQVDAHGNQRMAIPLAQMLLDLSVAQLKLEAIFEELGAEQLVDPAKLSSRLLQKLDRETQQLKALNDARPTVQTVGGAVVAAINGSGRKG